MHTKTLKHILAYTGVFLSFLITNYWSYNSGSMSGQALLIDTMSKYRKFFDEVRAAPKAACTPEGHLRGLFRDHYQSMLPVIQGEVTPPYNNPCPPNIPPAPPTSLRLNVCSSWDTWEDFLADPNPTMGINIIDTVSIPYPIDEHWRNTIIKWHDEIVMAMETRRAECTDNESCDKTITITLKPAVTDDTDMKNNKDKQQGSN